MVDIDDILDYDFGPEVGGCPGDCDGCSTKVWRNDKWDKGKRRKKKRPDGGAALLRWLREAPPVAAAALLATHCPPKVLVMLDDAGDILMGRPRHPATACLLALLMQKARVIRSENELVKTLSTSVGSARFLRFLDLGGEHSKSPHNRVFTRTRKELWPLLEDLHTQLVREAMGRGLVKGRFVMLDTVPISLCEGCKHSSRCDWVLRGGAVHRHCPGSHHEGARPFHKDKDKRMMGWKMGTALDMETSLPLASVTFPGDVSDGRIGRKLLRMLRDRGVRPRFIVMDSAFDWYDIYRFCHEELGAIAVTALRHDWKARRFLVELDNGLMVYVTPCGTPFCAVGRMMVFRSLMWDDDEDRPEGTVWGCPLGPGEVASCAGHGGELCEVVLRPGMHWRRISLLPRVQRDWERLYRRRKVGEWVYSHWKQNLGLGDVTHRTLAGVEFHGKAVVLTALLAAVLAHDTGLGTKVRTLREVRRRIDESLLDVCVGSICPKAAECLLNLLSSGVYGPDFWGGKGKDPPLEA